MLFSARSALLFFAATKTAAMVAMDVKRVQVSLAEFRDLARNQLRKATAEKDEGSRLFGEGLAEEAEKKYVECLVMIDAAKSVEALKRGDFADLRGKMEALELVCHLNLAACALSCGRFEQALEESRIALSMDGRSSKALYRAGKALLGMRKFAEAAEVLGEASELSPGDRNVATLLAKAKRSAREVSKTQRASYGGMFSKSAYVLRRTREEEQEQAARVAERREVEGKLKDCMQSGADLGILDRWVSGGTASLDDKERLALVRVAQRAAASGRLDSAREREIVAKNGIGISGSVDEEEGCAGSAAAREAAIEQEQLLRVQALTAKLQEGGALSSEEAEFLQAFRRDEIERLERQLAGAGLGEQDRMVLEGLRAQEKRYRARATELESRSDEVESLLKRLESGRRVPVRQRLRMDELLSEERVRLEAKDDDQGLTSVEWKLLRQIQEHQEKKKKDEQARRDRLEQRRQTLGGGVG